MEKGIGSGPYMVPDGTKCGIGKACFKQSCLDKDKTFELIVIDQIFFFLIF